MKNIFYLITICLVLLSSCEYEAEYIKLPDFERKLVVLCFLSPADTIITARISYNMPLYVDSIWKYQIVDIKGVQVFLSDGEKEVQFTQKKNGELFLLNPKLMPIEEAKTYFLKVTDSLGNVATSQCTIPKYKEINLKIDTIYTYFNEVQGYWDTITNGYHEVTGIRKNIHYNLSLYANSNEKIDYRLVSYMHYCREVDTLNPAKYLGTKVNDISFFDGPNNGNIYKHSFDYYTWNHESFTVDSVFYKLQILQVSNEYCTYKKSLDKYVDVDSYFTEISPVYYNIKGGLGIFCGYTQKVYTLKINKDMVEYK
jgi:hypothetical protein